MICKSHNLQTPMLISKRINNSNKIQDRQKNV